MSAVAPVGGNSWSPPRAPGVGGGRELSGRDGKGCNASADRTSALVLLGPTVTLSLFQLQTREGGMGPAAWEVHGLGQAPVSQDLCSHRSCVKAFCGCQATDYT